MLSRSLAALIMIELLSAAPVHAERAAAQHVEALALKPLLQCRSIAAQTERLACYDDQVDALAKATTTGEVMVVDRAQVQQARRSVFGLALPSLSFLDRDTKDRPALLQEISAKIARAAPDPYGKWSFVLDDGSHWRQIEPFEFAADPKAGMNVRIRRAAMGSYLANIAGQSAVRVERLR